MRSRLRPSQTFQIVSLVLGQHDADRRLGSRHAAIVRPTAPGATFPPPSTRGRTSGDLYLGFKKGSSPVSRSARPGPKVSSLFAFGPNTSDQYNTKYDTNPSPPTPSPTPLAPP